MYVIFGDENQAIREILAEYFKQLGTDIPGISSARISLNRGASPDAIIPELREALLNSIDSRSREAERKLNQAEMQRQLKHLDNQHSDWMIAKQTEINNLRAELAVARQVDAVAAIQKIHEAEMARLQEILEARDEEIADCQLGISQLTERVWDQAQQLATQNTIIAEQHNRLQKLTRE